MEHVTPAQFDAFLQGTCGAEQAGAVESHIDTCDECRVLLSSLARAARSSSSHTTDVVQRPLPLRDGDEIGTKYRVERIIGSGGMGTVVAAWHQQLNQRVALKFMLPALSADPQAVARFQREARAAARLQTEHAGRVLDLDALPDGTPFLVMEFLEGETVEQRLERERRISPKLAVAWVRQALEALAEAHALGIVHRDLKPANLFLTKRADGSESIKVLDFGIAKSAHPDIERGLTSTSSRVMVGSPPYMAPEQLNPGSLVTARTDVWAVGAVLYQLMSGRLPFERENLVDLMYAIQNKPHRPLRELDGALPAALCAVVDGCLSKEPSRRPADAAAVLLALEGAEREPPPDVAPLWASSVRKPPKWLLPVAAGLAVGLGATVFALVRSQPAAPASEAKPAPVAAAAPAAKAVPPVVTTAPAHAPAPEPVPLVAPAPKPSAPHTKAVAAAVKPKVRPAAVRPAAKAPHPKPAQPDDDVFGDRR